MADERVEANFWKFTYEVNDSVKKVMFLRELKIFFSILSFHIYFVSCVLGGRKDWGIWTILKSIMEAVDHGGWAGERWKCRERAEMGESEGLRRWQISVRSKYLWWVTEKPGEIEGGGSMFETVISVVEQSWKGPRCGPGCWGLKQGWMGMVKMKLTGIEEVKEELQY